MIWMDKNISNPFDEMMGREYLFFVSSFHAMIFSFILFILFFGLINLFYIERRLRSYVMIKEL